MTQGARVGERHPSFSVAPPPYGFFAMSGNVNFAHCVATTALTSNTG